MSSSPTDLMPSRRGSHADALGTAACVYLAMLTIGFAAFRRFDWTLPTGASHNADRTFFTSVNAVTLTGFKQSFAEVPNFPPGGLALLALLAAGGALVTLVTSALFLRSILSISLATRTIVLASAATLAVPWALTALAVGWFDAASAATTLGLAGRYALPAFAGTVMIAAAVPAAVGPLAILSLLGRRDGAGWRAMRVTILAFAAIYLVGTVACAVASPLHLPTASAVTLDARTLGLNDALPTSIAGGIQWLLVVLMAIGSPPGGLAGGLGLFPVVLIARYAAFALRGRGETSPLVGVAIVWVAAWIASALVALVTLAATEPQMPGDRLLFIVVAAISNAGLSHDPISIGGAGSVVLAATMVVGRILPLVMLCWMASLADRARATS